MVTMESSPRRCFGHAALLFLISFSLGPVSGQTPSVVGQWSATFDLKDEAIHAQLLPTGKVLFWGLSGTPKLWDPLTLAITAAAPVTALVADANLFCTGHSFLPDGTVLVLGGHVTGNVGQKYAFVYDAPGNSWTRLPDMNAARWYPTNTTLANGDVLVVSGQIDTTQGMNPLPQVWERATGRWRDLSTAEFILPFYPYMYSAPNGKVFMAGPEPLTRYLDTMGTGTWTNVGSSNFGARNWGSSVMYEPGRILIVGGVTCPMYGACGVFPTATAEVIDLNSATPAWRYVGSLTTPRKHHNTVLLPDGKVLVTGGSAGTEDTNSNSTNPAYTAELWDPGSPGAWTPLVSNTVYRGYHAVSLLLPDGRVLSAGGDYGGTTAEIYSPSYLFKGARPTITSAPVVVSYGQNFLLETPDATAIATVTWIAPAAVTHTFDQSQRFTRLSFSRTTGGITVSAPANANVAPPGVYMVFILNGQGVPSVAKFVRIQSGPASVPAAPTGLAAVARSSSQIDLSWNDTNAEDGYKIERSGDNVTFTQIGTVAANVTTFSSTGLSPATTYYFRTRAWNAAGDSAPSSVASATTSAAVVTAPAAPTALTAAVTGVNVTLRWVDNANNEAGFEIERSTTGATANFVRVGTAGQNQTQYRDTTTQKRATYWYRVRSYNSGGYSAYSNVVQARL